jgi:hypothetical protein
LSLTDLKLRNAKLKEKPYKLFDSRGLFLLVNPSGSKLWRYRYTLARLEKQISFGPYPEVSLADARDQCDEARKQLRQGINPSDLRKAKKIEQQRDENTFELVAQEWFAKFSPSWATSHSSKVIRRLEKDVFPWLGRRPISKIMANDLLKILRRKSIMVTRAYKRWLQLIHISAL